MNDNVILVVGFAAALAFGLGIGFIVATADIVRDCERLGAFSIDDKVFRCEVKR